MMHRGYESYEGIGVAEVGPALSRLRNAWGITQKGLAEAMDTTKDLLSKLERGKINTISMEQLQQGFAVFEREGYKITSVQDMIDKSNAPPTEEQMAVRQARVKSIHQSRAESFRRTAREKESGGLQLRSTGTVMRSMEKKVVQTLPAALGQAIASLRGEAKMSVEDVAGQLNMSPDGLRRLENNKLELPFSRDRMERMLGVLGSSLDNAAKRVASIMGYSKADAMAEMDVYFRSAGPQASHAQRRQADKEAGVAQRG